MTALLGYQISVVLIIVVTCCILLNDILKHKNELKGKDKYFPMIILAVITEFFDCLGIGSYGPQTAVFKKLKLVEDLLIPGTLNTCALTVTGVGTLLFITSVEMDIVTLICMVIASSIGSALGAKFVCKLDVTKIRWGMGIALVIVACVISAGQLGIMPSEGGVLLGLTGAKLVIACIVCAILGALMCIGIGCYAPTLAMICLMGMNPIIAYPVMYGNCAFLIPIAAIKFIREGRYNRKFAIVCNIFGLIGTFTAFYLITSVPLYALKWAIVAVLVYTSYTMIRDARKKKNDNDIDGRCCKTDKEISSST